MARYAVVALDLVSITCADTRRKFAAAFIPLTPVKRFCGCALFTFIAMAHFAGGACHLVAITCARARCEFAAFFPLTIFKRHGGEAFLFLRAMLRFAAGTSHLVFMTRAPTPGLSAAKVPLAILKGLTGVAFHVLILLRLLRASFFFAVGTFDVVFFPSAPTECLFFAHIFQKFRTLLAFGVRQHRIQKFRTLLAFSVQQHRIPNDV